MSARAPVAVALEGPPSSPRYPLALRTLRRAGKDEVVVALPRDWLRDLGWQVGGQVGVWPLPGRGLFIGPENLTPGASRVEIHAHPRSPPEHLFRQLLSAYLAGTDEIVLRLPAHPDAQTRRVVSEFVRRVSRFEVVSETPESVLLHDVSRADPPALPLLVRRLFQLTLDLQRDAGRSWVEEAPGGPTASFAVRDDDVDRLAWLVERTLVRGALRGSPLGFEAGEAAQGVYLLMVARALERVADHAVRLHEEGVKLACTATPPELRRSLTQLHRHVLELLVLAGALINRPDPVRSNQLIDSVEGVDAERWALIERSLRSPRDPGAASSLLISTTLILESLVRTASYVADLGELAMDLDAHHGIGRTDLRVDLAPEAPGPSVTLGARPSGALHAPLTGRDARASEGKT